MNNFNLKYFLILILFLENIFSVKLFSQNDSTITTSLDSLQLISSFGKFQNAVSISTAREEFIFISDLETNTIYKFSKEGSQIASFGGSGLGQNELNQPYSIDASNGLDVLVADYQNNRIKRLDLNLNYILQFDFNSYNLTAESSKKIYNPNGVLTLSTGEIFVLADATNYKVLKINDYSDVTLVFGSATLGQEKLDNPVKMVKGSSLDIWILDKNTGDIVNFNNFGVFVKRLVNPEKNNPIISIANFNDNLYILHSTGITVYDLKRGKYNMLFYIPLIKNLTDIAVIDKSTVLLLSKDSVHIFLFPN
ncbi:MAG: hypothetical protein IT280_04840 [Ignavibacteria bacterium]|nr:hypothetical protein [Ignavibacteria bacterium]